ncbi:MAG: matrixin family metalloprotease [Oligoflexia bacterium]|nr:matrixin family metalloprotease [Oligoflexia bacterium]
MQKLLLFTLFLLLIFGFRLIDRFQKWNIHENDPYLWIKLCDRSTLFQENTLPKEDPLTSRTDISIAEAMQTIVDDYNSLYGSYLRLELYPADTNAPAEGSTFTVDRAKKRTIDICDSDLFMAGGQASWEYEGEKIVGCTIRYQKGAMNDVHAFLSVLTHEIGHCVGLHHPQESIHAIMSYFANRELYRLQIDDKMGVRYLYPQTLEGIDHKEHNSMGMSCHYRAYE